MKSNLGGLLDEGTSLNAPNESKKNFIGHGEPEIYREEKSSTPQGSHKG